MIAGPSVRGQEPSICSWQRRRVASNHEATQEPGGQVVRGVDTRLPSKQVRGCIPGLGASVGLQDPLASAATWRRPRDQPRPAPGVVVRMRHGLERHGPSRAAWLACRLATEHIDLFRVREPGKVGDLDCQLAPACDLS
jgi:hypothetical protein